MILNFQLTINTDDSTFSIINTDTGQIEKVDIPKTTNRKKKTKVEESSNPTITLLENKLQFNTAAVELMGLVPEDRVDIKYEQIPGGSIPIISKDDSGNRLTKSYTIQYKGVKNQELSKHGTEFIVERHPNKDGFFILNSGKEIPQLVGDENVNIENTDLDFDIESLLEDSDATEIKDSIFTF